MNQSLTQSSSSSCLISTFVAPTTDSLLRSQIFPHLTVIPIAFLHIIRAIIVV